MKHFQRRAAGIGVLLGIILVAGLGALAASNVSAANPYAAISQRNVFDLHAPVGVRKPPAWRTPVLPKITLTGITTILGKKLAFLTVPSLKPGARPEFLALAEGQAQSDIEVREINDRAGLVKIINHGEPQTLDFEPGGARGVPAPGGLSPFRPRRALLRN